MTHPCSFTPDRLKGMYTPSRGDGSELFSLAEQPIMQNKMG